MGNHQYIDVLDKLVYNYNHSFHRSIEMTPIEANKKINEFEVYENLYLEGSDFIQSDLKFKPRDKARISKYKKLHR
jgi:hypothetical protein